MDQKNYLYKFHGVDLIEKSLSPVNIIEGDQFNFNIRTQSAVDDTRKIVVIMIEVNISKLSESKIIGKFVAAFGFEITNMDEVFTKNDNGQYLVPTELENLLKSISISTMRGIIFSELRGTVLHRAIMPIIPMDSLKPEAGNLIEDIRGKI